MSEQIYDAERARRLVELLRALGARIAALKNHAELLALAESGCTEQHPPPVRPAR